MKKIKLLLSLFTIGAISMSCTPDDNNKDRYLPDDYEGTAKGISMFHYEIFRY